MATAEVCPVVGTTNHTLPPSHPDIDLSKPGQTCPVVGAKTEHHTKLHQHPSVSSDDVSSATTKSIGSADAQACPALRGVVNEAKSKEMGTYNISPPSTSYPESRILRVHIQIADSMVICL